MSGRFTSFVLFAEMRTGSNHLQDTLNQVPGVQCHGEAFNPYFLGEEHRTEMLGVSQAARDRDPRILLDAMRQAAPGGLSGFRFFHDHDPRVLGMVLEDRSCAKVILTRAPAESYVSKLIADATGYWRITDEAHRVPARVRFDPEEYADHVAAIEGFRARLRRALQERGQTAFELDYEHILDPQVLTGLVRFLGVADVEVTPSRRLKRQNPGPLRDKVSNPEEMAAALEGRGTAAPVRRGPVPGWLLGGILALERPPLMVLGLPGGPEAALRSWLEGLGPLALGAEGAPCTQSALRQWLNRNKARQVAAVVTHPALRAWRLFRQSGRPVSEGGFAAFLEGLEAPPQAALLARLAEEAIPDRVLREDDMAEGLSAMAPTAPAPLLDGTEAAELTAIWTPGHEAALRRFWTRDYRVFGFRRWGG